MAGLFITGGSGFVGTALLRRLAERAVADAAVLTRSHGGTGTEGPGWRWLYGDLLDSSSYRTALERGGTVLHLAAATGRASARRHREVNVEGTSRLLAAARRAGSGRIVYVSSIAARFEDIRYYPYAAAKREAERLVRESGIPYTIVRPTMVFGPGSPVEQGLRRLATAPVPFVFGSGDVRVQPVDVEVLAQRLIEVVEATDASGDVLEIGGPEILSLNELLERLRRASGKGPARIRHIPVRPVRAILAGIEAVIGPRLPITAGQLASFINDGTVMASGSAGTAPGHSPRLTA